MGPRQELVEELMTEAKVEFHMYSSERFLSYGLDYLKEQVNKQALEEIQEMKRVEVEQYRRIRDLERNEIRQRRNIAIENKKELRLFRERKHEIDEQIMNIRNQIRHIPMDAEENTEVQEITEQLRFNLRELTNERKKLRNIISANRDNSNFRISRYLDFDDEDDDGKKKN